MMRRDRDEARAVQVQDRADSVTLRDKLKARVDELTEEEVAALLVLLGPSEDELAAASETLQAEIATSLAAESDGTPIEQVARRYGIADV